jgi:phosphonate transport system substrate-binding protein
MDGLRWLVLLLSFRTRIRNETLLRTSVRFTILLLVLAALISPLGCGQQPEYNKIDFRNVETEEVPASELPAVTFRLAAAGVLSPTEELKIYEQLITYFSRELHQPVELVQRRTYNEINDLVKSRYVDFAFVCGFPYVSGHEEFGMELLVVPEVNGETVYYSYIIVPASSTAKELKDLKGKSFAFADPLSNSGRLAPTYKLHQLGETATRHSELR